MWIRHLDILAFGGLRDVSSGSDPLGDLVVVEGRNEAGKSTLFEFLCTLLYGVYPTSPDRHPFTPWDGSELAGRGLLETRQGETVEVTRRLLSAPSATLVRQGRSENLRNEDLPFVSHVPQRVFRQVYALTLAELASLQDEGWEAVQDRILGRLGAVDLRPAREVAEELETEARAIWRPDRRGSPLVRRLDESIREAAGRRPDLRARSARRRTDAARLAETRAVLASARDTRKLDQSRLSRLRILVPVRKELAGIADLRAEAGDATELAALPSSPEAELDRLLRDVDEARTEVETLTAEHADLALEREAFTAADASFLEQEGEIEAYRLRVAGADPLRARLAAIEQELRGLDRRLTEESDRLPWSTAPDTALLTRLQAGALTQAHARWEEAWRRVDERWAAPPSAPATPVRLAGTAWILLVAGSSVGVIGAVTRASLGPTGLLVVALVALVVGVLGVWLLYQDRRRLTNTREESERRSRDEGLRVEHLRQARDEVTAVLAPAGLVAGDTPDRSLPGRLDRCREWLRDREDLVAEASALQAKFDALDAEAAHLTDVGAAGSPGAAAGTAALLQERLKDVRDRAATARRAAERLTRLKPRLEAAQDRLVQARSALRALEDRLVRFAPGDARAGATAASRCIEAAREADLRMSRLRAEHADLESLTRELGEAEANAATWLSDPDPIADLQTELNDLTERIEGWRAEEADLEARVAMGDDEETLDELEGELTRLREERQRLRREHDRLWILSRLVDEADLRVREAHQPEILRRTGVHLTALTDGRYDRIEVTGDRSRTLRVSGPALPAGLDVGPPLSTGTREQIYVALRLALVDHLDEGGARLPLFLDEVFVNWDAPRRRNGLDLLVTAARKRQVFLFTCHPHLADEAVARGATHWRLEGP